MYTRAAIITDSIRVGPFFQRASHSGTQACKPLREEGYGVVLINSTLLIQGPVRTVDTQGNVQPRNMNSRRVTEMSVEQSETAVLTEVVRRIVDVAHPERIILFGSAARGQIGPDSDFDLLIVVPPGAHRRHLTMDIYRRLSGVGCPVDVVVVTSEDVERYGRCPALIIEPALREGREVYHG